MLPAGQRHELGALLVAGIAADQGWRVMYLGTDLPAEEIAAAVDASRASVVLLSLVYPMPDTRLLDEVRLLRKLVGSDVLLVSGGRAAVAMREELAASGIAVIQDLEDLRPILEERAG